MINKSVLDLAVEVARTSPSRQKIGAVLLYKNKVITTACNLDKKSHPIQAKFAKRVGLHEKIYLHAEIACLVKCRHEVDTIVVARVNSQNKLRLAKPCKICQYAIKEAGVSNVYYSTNDGFVYQYSL